MSQRTVAQQKGRIGGLTRKALAESPQAITEAARAARWQKYMDRVSEACPHITDQGELSRRAELLRQADMISMSMKAVKAKRLKAEAAALEAELNATGLADSGSDGIDA